MRYELMFPHQIREAIAKNIPVVLALGVLEYHGEHLSTGVDTLVITRALDELEQDIPMVVFPAFYYGASSYAVAASDSGTIHSDPKLLYPFALNLFENLLCVGFKNIHVFVHHQSENFRAGMPTDLSFKLGARQAIFNFLERKNGEGWWGNSETSDYYERHLANDDPFNWISVHPFVSEEIQKAHPIDHAGKLETALMMAFCPEGVDMTNVSDSKWYTRSAVEATPSYGFQLKNLIMDHLRDTLKVKSYGQ